jgi:hypothetical protein
MSKRFNVQANIGKARHVVNFHDGKKRHPDGSDFFDIEIFKSIRLRDRFVRGLRRDGYAEE